MDIFKRPDQIVSGLSIGLSVGTAIYLPKLADHYDKKITELSTHLKRTVIEVQDLLDQRDENKSLKQELSSLKKEMNTLKSLVRSLIEEKKTQLIPVPIQVPSQSQREFDILLGMNNNGVPSKSKREEENLVQKSVNRDRYERDEIIDDVEEEYQRCEEDEEEEALRAAALSALNTR